MSVTAIVPAAGKAERFGAAKLLADLDGEPLIERTLRSLREGGVEEVVLVLGPEGPLTASDVPIDERVRLAINPDPGRGMFSSLQAGFAVADGTRILVLPGDMPFVRAATVAAVVSHAQLEAVILPTVGRRHGHPIAIPGSLRPAILAADPASNLKTVLASTGAPHVELLVDDPGILRDVDVPGDL